MLPQLSVSAAEATEATGTITFRVVLSDPSQGDVTVNYRAVQNGTAIVGNGDVSSTSGEDTFTLTIPAGQTVGTIQYSIERFINDEFDENFTLELFDPENAVLA
ncbi:MAG: hypothetical protein AAF922_18860, partial [Pseudomonadota bacterium]